MKKLLIHTTYIFPSANRFHISMLLFRILLSAELIIVHGLKKIGVGVTEAEQVPNPFHLPDDLNQGFAIAANLILPILIAAGFLTRLAAIPALIVTLTGYFIVHAGDPIAAKDIPFMYSLSLLLILLLGPGKYAVDKLINQQLTKH
jgi:putative oxidoreductase